MFLEKLKFLIFLILSIRGTLCATDETEDKHSISLTSDNFDENIGKSNNFVMFFAPWCGHCKRLHPLWGELAKKMNEDSHIQVQISNVDCTQHQELCAKHEVTGYPTLRFFKLGSSESVKFKGARDMTSLTEFLTEQIGKKDSPVEEETSPVEQPALIELTDETFYDHISSGKHFIKFYAPWCGHCQRLAPTWDDLASKIRDSEHSVKICKIDCTVYRPICQDFEVKGYPTLLWIENGKKIEKYAGARDLDNLSEFVEKMAGSPQKPTDEIEPPKKVTPPKLDKGVLIVNGNDHFQKLISSNELTFVKFYAPWCGHCQKLQPTWDQLAKKVDSRTQIAKVDCTAQDNRELCVSENVDGYPTLLIYKNAKKIDEYNGSRQLDDLLQFTKRNSESEEKHDEL